MGTEAKQISVDDKKIGKPTITLYNADCLEIMKSMPDSVDLVLTDPPYPDGDLGYSGDADISFLQNFNCRQFIFWSAIAKFPLDYSTIHIWDKCKGGGAEYERIFERNGNKQYHCWRSLIATNQVFAKINYDFYTGHPAQKPIGLIKKLILKYSKPNNIVFDPFMGSGTTGVACKLLRRSFIGIEISKEYFELAKRRIDSTEWGMFE